jgi:hypothetical protein
MTAAVCDPPVEIDKLEAMPPGPNGRINAEQREAMIAAARKGLLDDLCEASPSLLNGGLSRPGISSEFLRRHNIGHVQDWQTEELLGFKASSGIWISYPGLHSREMVVNGRPFGRLRLDHPRNGAKYLSPRESGAQLYIPEGAPFGRELVIVEGEFKALALCEAGIRAVGIGGIQSAMSDGKLIPDLGRVLSKYHPRIVYFLGDNDTCFIFDFAREAVKLAKALPEGSELRLPRISLSIPKGIDDCRQKLGGGFLAFWQDITAKAVVVPRKDDPSALAVRLLATEWDTISKDKDEYFPKLLKLGRDLSPTALDELARKVKGCWRTSLGAFKQEATQRNHGGAEGSELEIPLIYFDGVNYYRPEGESYASMCRQDALLELRVRGFQYGPPGAGVHPAEIALHKIQTQNRVHYAGAICGRPPGIHKEGTMSVLSTAGPRIIEGFAGEFPTIMELLCNLLGKDREPLFEDQFLTLVCWLRHGRAALKNHKQHMPGQALALVGPVNCGKSLLQHQIITPTLGGRDVDASIYVLGHSHFNKELWGAEHLVLGDDAMGDDGRERHAVRDRLKKLVVAQQFPLHAKKQDAESFRPIWRVTISANDDDESITVLPPPDESFGDKIIYIRCYPPPRPFHDGTEQARREFEERLRSELPAFIHKVESGEIPDHLRSSRFYVREFHHPYVLEQINATSPVVPLGELIDEWMASKSLEVVGGSAAEILGQLTMWAAGSRVQQATRSALHFGHQLRRLSKLPGWKNRVSKIEPVRIGDRKRNQEVQRWRITRSAEIVE